MDALTSMIDEFIQLMTPQPFSVFVNYTFPWGREENAVVPLATSGDAKTLESEVLVGEEDSSQESSLQTVASETSSLEGEKPDPVAFEAGEVDGTSTSQPKEQETPGKLEEKENGNENNEDLSSVERDHVQHQGDVTAAPESVREGILSPVLTLSPLWRKLYQRMRCNL